MSGQKLHPQAAVEPPPKAQAALKKPPRPPLALADLGKREPSGEAKRLAAILLEVLAGARTPSEAAAALGVSLPRYYALEIRALEGFLGACRPLLRGPQRSPEREAAKLQREVARLERESARYQALLRAQRRAVGLPPREKPKAEPGRKRRARRPTARALKAVAALKGAATSNVLENHGRKEEDGESGRA